MDDEKKLETPQPAELDSPELKDSDLENVTGAGGNSTSGCSCTCECHTQGKCGTANCGTEMM
jgi:hypothetical protein